MTPRLSHRNGILYIDNTPIQESALTESYLTAEAAAAATTITVKNITGFAIGQILLIEELGTENAEIVLTHASTVPSGTTVTTAALVKTHPAGSRVFVIGYNRIELKRGTTTTASDATALTLATTANANPISALGSGLVAIDPTMRVQRQETSEHTSGYYFARYSNSVTSDFSGYTDALEYGGWSPDTVGYIIDRALRDSGVETLSQIVSRNDCYEWLTACLTLYEGKQLRIPEHYNFNYALTTLAAGDYQYSVPTDIYDSKSNRSILAVRIGSEGTPLRYLDPIEFEEMLDQIAETTAAETGSVGETDIDLTNASDFADSGSVTYYVSGTQYSFTYAGKENNLLTDIPSSGTGSITQAFTPGDTMYQNPTVGEPLYFTVREGSLDLSPIPDANAHGKSVFMDYATVATTINSDGDSVDRKRYNMALAYLTWRIWCKAKNNGDLDKNSGFYTDYKEALNDLIRTSPRNIKFPFRPKVNRMRKR